MRKIEKPPAKLKKIIIEVTPLFTVLKDSVVLEMKITVGKDVHRVRETKPVSFFRSHLDLIIDEMKEKLQEIVGEE